MAPIQTTAIHCADEPPEASAVLGKTLRTAFSFSERFGANLAFRFLEAITLALVLGEIRSFFPSDGACRTALSDLNLRHSALSEEAANLAGRMFRNYRKEGGPWIRFCRISLLVHMLPPKLIR